MKIKKTKKHIKKNLNKKTTKNKRRKKRKTNKKQITKNQTKKIKELSGNREEKAVKKDTKNKQIPIVAKEVKEPVKKAATKQPKASKIIIPIIVIIIIAFLVYSTSNIVIWFMNNKTTEVAITTIQEEVVMDEIPDSKNTTVVATAKEPDKTSPYWSYIKTNLINVDFTELKKKNEDIEGWIKVEGTNINYPFVQTSDNSFYLNHSLDKKSNSAGWVFADYRNNISTLDRNTILYAHGRKDTTMFGSLKNILKSKWLDDENNYIIRMSTPTNNTLWQVFSVYKIPTTSDYLKVSFSTDDSFLEFENMLKERSAFNFNTTTNSKDKIITLSTCYSNTERMVLHAKLIKIEKK